MPVQPYLADIFMAGFNFAPNGFATCDGQVLPINTNTALFSLLGTTYGGDGLTNFALPDMRGRVPMHMGQGTGLSNRAIGQIGGVEALTLTQSQLPAHSHALSAAATAANSQSPTGNALAIPREDTYSTVAPSAALAASSVGSTGGGTPVNAMPPFLVVNFYIALVGSFPSRP